MEKALLCKVFGHKWGGWKSEDRKFHGRSCIRDETIEREEHFFSKIYCDTCNGDGTIEIMGGYGNNTIEYSVECPDCNGNRVIGQSSECEICGYCV